MCPCLGYAAEFWLCHWEWVLDWKKLKWMMGSYLQGGKSNFLVDLTAARLLWLEALDGWQQDSMPSWAPSTKAFVRGGKRNWGKNVL